MAERETEFKYVLEPSQSESLRAALGAPLESRRFSNKYYTLSGERQRKDWVLRVRQDDSRAVLTLKIGREVSPGVFDSMEYTAEVTDGPESWEDSEPMHVFRREISAEPVHFQGEMQNLRECFRAPVAVGEVWELDSATLPDGTGFSELEIEVKAELEELTLLRATVERWLESCGVPPVAGTLTKYARFLAAVGETV